MAANPHPHPSFSPARKWGIALQVSLLVLIVLSVVVMANYISRDHFTRFHWSTRTRNVLSPRTLKFLASLTNRVQVTLYYDKEDELYSTALSLLDEYHYANPAISVETVDYQRDPAAAQRVRARYKLASAADKNLIVFETGGKMFPVDGKALAQYTYERVQDKDAAFRRKLIAFEGEKMFTAALIAVTNPKPLSAYALQGHGEHPIDGGDEVYGYLNFKTVLEQNYIQVQPLSLVGTNSVPGERSLLIIAGPRTRIPDAELQKIDQYLVQGGRLLALFNADSAGKETGLEAILAKWGVAVGNDVVADPEHSQYGPEVIVSAFSTHPVVSSLLYSGLYLVRPRTVSKLQLRSPAADAPRVEEIAFTGTNAVLAGRPDQQPRPYPLMVAVEKGAIKNVVTERGTTRIVVVGDSLFLGNRYIALLSNSDFAALAVNWLLNRAELVQGIGPRPITEYRLVMTKAQLRGAEWLLLAGLPGGVLLLGGLVWLRRRG